MLETKLSDKTWTETQDEEFIKALEKLKDLIESLSAQIYIFVDYFEQYYTAILHSPIYAAPTATYIPENGEVSPTQTPANRAERRSKKRQTPFQAQGIDNA